jgi:hypothetical protein
MEAFGGQSREAGIQFGSHVMILVILCEQRCRFFSLFLGIKCAAR